VSTLISQGYTIQGNLIEDKEALIEAMKRLDLMEMEGKFEVSRAGVLLAAEERPRNDKVFSFNLPSIEKIEEYKDMHKIARLLYCLPFELNMKAPFLQLQLTEHIEISFFSPPDSLWHRRHKDSGLTKETDTGIKVTLLFLLCSDDAEGEIKIFTS
jgi:hypothetical protein